MVGLRCGDNNPFGNVSSLLPQSYTNQRRLLFQRRSISRGLWILKQDTPVGWCDHDLRPKLLACNNLDKVSHYIMLPAWLDKGVTRVLIHIGVLKVLAVQAMAILVRMQKPKATGRLAPPLDCVPLPFGILVLTNNDQCVHELGGTT